MDISNSVTELSPTTVRATEPRHDLYGLIHKGLRSFMLDTLAALGRLDVASASDFSAAIAQTRALLATLHGHLQHENEFIHPLLEARSPGAARAALEHADHEQAFVELERALRHVERAFAVGGGAELDAQLKQLYLKLSTFVADNLAHMYREETEITKLLWRHCSDDELRAIQSAIVASESPEELATTLRWMLPSVTPKERLGLLGGARQGLPPEAFRGVMRLAEQVLTAGDYRQLAGALG